MLDKCKFGLMLAVSSLMATSLTFTTGAVERVLPGHVPARVRSLQPMASVEPAATIKLAISLPLRNTNDLQQLLRDLYNPASPQFRHYLTSEEFTRRFGPSEADYEALKAFCRGRGLTVTKTHANRLILDAAAPASAIDDAFHTSLRQYQHPTENRTFYAPDTEPSVEAGTPILHVQGLDNLQRPRPLMRQALPGELARATPNVGSGTSGSFLGKDFRATYTPGVALTGQGQVVALVEFDGYYTNDITRYLSRAGLAAVPLQNVLIGAFNGSPGSGNGEVSLDIQMAIAMAPGLAKVMVYEGGLDSLAYDVLNQIATDNAARQISCSWTWGRYDPGTDQIFQQYAAQGQTFFQASGDSGAWLGGIDAPADNPWITVVGGTTLTSAANAWAGETVWNDYQGSAGGGGVSTIYPIPDWQRGVSMAFNGGSASQRNIPDVAMVADNIQSYSDNGKSYIIVGTSAAAPLWAGFTALINQQAAANGRPAIGFLNPTLYTLGRGPNYLAAFHDIASGDNTSSTNPTNYLAVAGYDLCTGWGTPKGSNTINLLLQVANNQIDHLAWAAVEDAVPNVTFPVTLSALTASNNTAANFSGLVNLTAIQLQTNTLFSRDFESGTLSDWAVQNGHYSYSIDTSTGAAGTGSSLALSGGDGTNSYNGLSHSLPSLRPDWVVFYVRASDAAAAGGYVVAGRAAFRTNSVFHFRLDSSGTMGLTDAAGNFYGAPFTASRWYQVALGLHWTNQTVSYYVDGSLVMDGIPFCNPSVTNLAVINLYNFDNTSVWYDQISLLQTASTRIDVSPARVGPFTNGRWSGAVSLAQNVTNVVLTAADDAGHAGTSNPFNVGYISRSITVVADPVGGGTVSGGGTFIVGSQQTLTATPADGWSFRHWDDGSLRNPRTITVPETNATFTAIFGLGVAPRIATGPASQTVPAGSSVSFTVSASEDVLGCQWSKGGVPLSDGPNVTGAGATTLTLANVLREDQGAYTVVVTNSHGAVSSLPATLQVMDPAIVTQPANAAIGVGLTNSFGVLAAGTGPLSYQWYSLIGGRKLMLAGQTNSTLSLGPATTAMAGGYFVVVTNQLSAPNVATSSVANLAVSIWKAPVSVQVVQAPASGKSGVSPNYSGQLLQLGKSYSMTAKPGPLQVFTGWSGSLTSAAPALHFVMLSNLAFTATFAPSPFIPLAGTYQGLFFDTNGATHASSGFMSAVVTAAGGFSAKLRTAASTCSLSGQFSAGGSYSNVLNPKSASPLTVNLHLDMSGSGLLTGELSSPSWTAELTAYRALFDAKTNPTTLAGKYTFLLPSNADSAAAPGGNGFGTLTVQPSGSLQLSGTLGDGTALTPQAASLVSQGQWPLYAVLNAGKSSLLGWLSVTSQGTNDVAGTVDWFKLPQPTSKLYPTGFVFRTDCIGSAFLPTNGASLLNFGPGLVLLSQGNLESGFAAPIVLGTNGFSSASTNKLSLTLSRTTGQFQGSVTDPSSGQPVSVRGVVLQKQNLGGGFFLGTNQSGSVWLQPLDPAP